MIDSWAQGEVLVEEEEVPRHVLLEARWLA